MAAYDVLDISRNWHSSPRLRCACLHQAMCVSSSGDVTPVILYQHREMTVYSETTASGTFWAVPGGPCHGYREDIVRRPCEALSALAGVSYCYVLLRYPRLVLINTPSTWRPHTLVCTKRTPRQSTGWHFWPSPEPYTPGRRTDNTGRVFGLIVQGKIQHFEGGSGVCNCTHSFINSLEPTVGLNRHEFELCSPYRGLCRSKFCPCQSIHTWGRKTLGAAWIPVLW